jgi:hypothetical protein
MVLSADQLNDWDESLLELLGDGRISPQLARLFLIERQSDPEEVPSAQYLGQRLRRLAEHGHIENLKDQGIYELTDDPRRE